MPKKVPKVKLGLKNLAMLPSYFDYIFVHLRQKVRLKPELNPKFLSFRPETDPKSPARLTTLIRIKQQWLLDDRCCCSCAFLSSCCLTASDANYWTMRTLFFAMTTSCLKESALV